MDQELQHFLISRTEGEALESVRGAEREPGLAKIGCCLHRKLPKWTTSHTSSNPGKILEQRHRERYGDQLPEDMRLAVLLFMCPTDLEKKLTAQQHLFPDCAQNKGSHCDRYQ